MDPPVYRIRSQLPCSTAPAKPHSNVSVCTSSDLSHDQRKARTRDGRRTDRAFARPLETEGYYVCSELFFQSRKATRPCILPVRERFGVCIADGIRGTSRGDQPVSSDQIHREPGRAVRRAHRLSGVLQLRSRRRREAEEKEGYAHQSHLRLTEVYLLEWAGQFVITPQLEENNTPVPCYAGSS